MKAGMKGDFSPRHWHCVAEEICLQRLTFVMFSARICGRQEGMSMGASTTSFQPALVVHSPVLRLLPTSSLHHEPLPSSKNIFAHSQHFYLGNRCIRLAIFYSLLQTKFL